MPQADGVIRHMFAVWQNAQPPCGRQSQGITNTPLPLFC